MLKIFMLKLRRSMRKEQQLKRLDEASRAESEDIKDIVAEIVPTYKRECKV